MIIEYEAEFKLLRETTLGKKSNVAKVYRAARTVITEDESIPRPASDMSEASALMQDLADNLWPIEGAARLLFNAATCTIQAGSDKITPETDLSSYPEEVRTFAQVIYSYDNNKYSDLYYAMQVEETPPEPTEAERIEIKRNLVLGELGKQFQAKFYSNIQTKDKSGDPVTIQFRDDKDRANFETVVNSADILSRNSPDAVVTFRCLDNKVHTFTASDFVTMGMQVQQAKQTLLYAYGDQKAEVRALTTLDELNAYQI